MVLYTQKKSTVSYFNYTGIQTDGTWWGKDLVNNINHSIATYNFTSSFLPTKNVLATNSMGDLSQFHFNCVLYGDNLVYK